MRSLQRIHSEPTDKPATLHCQEKNDVFQEICVQKRKILDHIQPQAVGGHYFPTAVVTSWLEIACELAVALAACNHPNRALDSSSK
jgi:hypothetical protein